MGTALNGPYSLNVTLPRPVPVASAGLLPGLVVLPTVAVSFTGPVSPIRSRVPAGVGEVVMSGVAWLTAHGSWPQVLTTVAVVSLGSK